MSSYFLVSSYTNTDILAHLPTGTSGSGLSLLEVKNGVSRVLWSLDLADNIAFLKQQGSLIYASTETIKSNGDILVISADLQGAKITDKVNAGGKSTCYLNIHDNCITAVNYWDAKLTTYGLNPDGKFGMLQQIKKQHDSDYVDAHNPSREDHWKYRQNWSHAHCMVTEPYENRYHYVIDLGNDLIRHIVYNTDKQLLVETRQTCLEKGWGPRHIVFHPTAQVAYIVNELVSTVSVFSYHKDEFNLIQTLSTLPDDYDNKLVNDGHWKAQSHASEIRLHRDILYISNRGHNSIAMYKVTDNGMLNNPSWIQSGGDTPRNFNFSLDGKLLLVGNQNTDQCCLFDLDTKELLSSLILSSPNFIIPFNPDL